MSESESGEGQDTSKGSAPSGDGFSVLGSEYSGLGISAVGLQQENEAKLAGFVNTGSTNTHAATRISLVLVKPGSEAKASSDQILQAFEVVLNLHVRSPEDFLDLPRFQTEGLRHQPSRSHRP